MNFNQAKSAIREELFRATGTNFNQKIPISLRYDVFYKIDVRCLALQKKQVSENVSDEVFWKLYVP